MDGPRDELLAGTSFAPDQDRYGEVADSLDRRADPPDSRTVADHAVQGGCIADVAIDVVK